MTARSSESVTVTVPARRECAADVRQLGQLSVALRAEFGRAACEVGDVDHGESDRRTSAVDTIANVLHWAADLGDESDPASIVSEALSHFCAEHEGPTP